jgi:hypothetical protein
MMDMAAGRKMNKQWVEQLRKEFTRETGMDWRNDYFQDWLKRKLLPKVFKPQTLH